MKASIRIVAAHWLVALPLVAFVAIVSAFSVLWLVQQSIAGDRLAELQTAAESTAKRLNDLTLNGPLMGAASFVGTTDPVIRRLALNQSSDDDPEAMQRLAQLRSQFGAGEAFVADAKGRIAAYSLEGGAVSGTGKNIGFRPYFRQAMQGRANVYAAVGTNTAKRGLYFAVPIKDEQGAPIGLLAVKVGLEEVDALFGLRATPSLLISPQGVVFSGNRSEWLFNLAGSSDRERIAAIQALKQFGNVFNWGATPRLPFDPDAAFGRWGDVDLGIASAALAWPDEAGKWSVVLTDDRSAWLSDERRFGILVGTGVMAGLLALVVVFLVRAQAQRQAARERLNQSLIQLAQEKEEVERALNRLNEAHAALNQANHHINESIRYASRIQTSLLPDNRSLDGMLHDIAVGWSPRDVVGGDFYWVGRFGDRCIIAVMDCTGHGVPGAFMTAIVASVLDRILHEHCHDNPAMILQLLNRLVKNSLRQQEQTKSQTMESDDGLDAAVCLIDTKKRSLTFAGAGIPLLYRQGDTMVQIKGDRQSLGYRTSRVDYLYTNHVVDLGPGMTFYLATDGTTDQVGGPNGRLFGRKRLIETLQALGDRPAQEQLDCVMQALESYRQGETPRDDMTMIVFTPLHLGLAAESA